jgi:hypothetical protein
MSDTLGFNFGLILVGFVHEKFLFLGSGIISGFRTAYFIRASPCPVKLTLIRQNISLYLGCFDAGRPVLSPLAGES